MLSPSTGTAKSAPSGTELAGNSRVSIVSSSRKSPYPAEAGSRLTGISIMEGRQQRLAEARLAHALSKLNIDPDSVTTNSVRLQGVKTGSAHRNVEVMVIQ